MSAGELTDEPRLRPDQSEAGAEDGQALLGQIGSVFTDLRPAGKVVLDGEYLDVVSEGPYIESGRQIEIVSVSGNRIVVRAV